MSTPILLTMGDPAGVGPEIIAKALAERDAAFRSRVTVLGDPGVMTRAAEICGVALPIVRSGDASDGIRIEHVETDGLPEGFGRTDPACGDASYCYIARAVEHAKADPTRCIVTAPINKAALNAAGHHFDGHTGMLAHLTGTDASWMLLASEKLNVIHVSTHVSLKDAIGRATSDRVAETVRVGHDHLRRMGLEAPRIAVAGINPHCGEGGLFGDEDDSAIGPGVEAARREGIDVEGPIPADTVYHRAHRGAFDLVVAQYHDQGHIPIKLVAFDTAVNVTLGLPINRCSVDHGTAFDIAGTGRADHTNMLSALAYADRIIASGQGK